MTDEQNADRSYGRESISGGCVSSLRLEGDQPLSRIFLSTEIQTELEHFPDVTKQLEAPEQLNYQETVDMLEKGFPALWSLSALCRSAESTKCLSQRRTYTADSPPRGYLPIVSWMRWLARRITK
jgi:hypothetical protein